MELKLYNRLKQQLLEDFASCAEAHDPDYQKQVEAFTSRRHCGLPAPMGRKIRKWLDYYNQLTPKKFKLRYYQILALYFTEHVLEQKRAGKSFDDQKALVYWMATGSGKTLLMHLNILQFIDHIGGGQAFDELQLVLTTPGVNLIDQHERELGELVRKLNRHFNNRIKLIVSTTGALLNREPGFFNMPESKRLFRLVLVDEGHIGLAGGGNETGAFKQLRHDLLKSENSFLFEYSATYHGIAERHVREYEEQIVYDYNYYRFYKDGYGKDYALQSLNDDRFADTGKSEAAFFGATFDALAEKLSACAHLSVSKKRTPDELSFVWQFSSKPLLAFMGNTVEDPRKEGSDKDEVSDIRKFVVWLAHMDMADREKYGIIFNGEYAGRLTLARSPGIQDEIWLSWGEGRHWGLINVGNGDRFFNDCDQHPQLRNAGGESLVTLTRAGIVNPRYHFAAIDNPSSPINVLVGSRKFAEGWNCFRLSIIGLINLGTAKGNKIIQIFGRGVRLKGLREDGKRRNLEHCPDYQALLEEDTPENQLRRLETLNVYSLRRSWLETFLKALEQDLPVVSGPYTIDVQPSLVRIGKKRQVSFKEYQSKLHAFKIGRSEFDAPLRITFDAANHDWHWQYIENETESSGTLPNPGIHLDYRADKTVPGRNLVQSLRSCLKTETTEFSFLPADWLQQRLLTWCRQQRVQLYCRENGNVRQLILKDVLPAVGQVLYDTSLDDRSWDVVEHILDEVQRDLLEKIFYKARYDIDKRRYRYETVQPSVDGKPGDFIERYSLTFVFDNEDARRAFEKKFNPPQQLELQLKEEGGHYHIYAPLLKDATEDLLKAHRVRRIGISPDKLNNGEQKFLRDILKFIDTIYAKDRREFYLMRNVESLRSIGFYLEGETRVFYPDFVLWIVDDKAKKTTLAFFDPKGQTGIRNEEDLGLNGEDGMNDKVRIANSPQLADLARQLEGRTGRRWKIRSYILLRDSSPFGRFKGAPTDREMARAEDMIRKGVLRLDWHDTDEQGNPSERLRDGSSYLSRIFEQIEKN